MKIFVGLGNPGAEYKDTRHNAGFMVIDNFLKKVESFKEKKYRYFISFCTEVDRNEAVLVKPRVYINESGIAVRKVLDTFKVKPEDLVIIHDDLGIKTGKIKITFNKGDNGHKGIISIFNEINTRDFYRIRIGIGKEEKIEIPYVEYVLSPFETEETLSVKEAIEKATEAVKEIVLSGIDKAMTVYNR